jgi:uncharacterized repeat protein (TIGR01451 family)
VLPSLPDSLKGLYCSDNHITVLPALLPPKLLELKCENNQLTTLPSLPYTLTLLFCSGNNLVYLPPLSASLDNLTCNDNELISLPALPSSLSSLHCNINQITTLPELPPSLGKLFCSNNLLTSLPELPPLLNTLDVSGNPITCLPLLPDQIQNLNYNFTYINCLPNIPDIFLDSLPLPLCLSTDTDNCALYPKISGTVFVDYNGNGVKDITDVPVSEMKIIADTENWMGYTDKNGNFEMSANFSNSVNITPIVPPGNYIVTPSSYSFAFNDSSNQSSANADFALFPEGNNYDLSTALTAGMAVPASVIVYSITYQNSSAFMINGTIQMVFDQNLSFVNADITPSSQTGYTLTWDFSSLAPFTSRFINVFFTVSGSVVPADTLICSVNGTLLDQTDVLPDNNVQVNKNPVMPTLQSDYMTVSEDTITPYDVTDGEYLEYAISFQNIGLTTSKNVEVFDTLSSSLDAGSFEMDASSYDYDLEITNAEFNPNHPTVLHWVFNNIQLPSANVDAVKSRALLDYRVKVNHNVSQNTMINNRAYILFDYSSSPIQSNLVSTMVVYPVGISWITDTQAIQISPNPFSDFININSKGSSSAYLITLYDLTGKILEQHLLSNNISQNLSLNLAGLSSGAYLMTVKSSEKTSSFEIWAIYSVLIAIISWAFNLFSNTDCGTTPTCLSTTRPFLKNNNVGIPRTPNWIAVSGFSSTFTLPITARPSYSFESSSITGAILRHGGHHSAQKSSNTGLSFSALSTVFLKLPSVIRTTIMCR